MSACWFVTEWPSALVQWMAWTVVLHETADVSSLDRQLVVGCSINPSSMILGRTWAKLKTGADVCPLISVTGNRSKMRDIVFSLLFIMKCCYNIFISSEWHQHLLHSGISPALNGIDACLVEVWWMGPRCYECTWCCNRLIEFIGSNHSVKCYSEPECSLLVLSRVLRTRF